MKPYLGEFEEIVLLTIAMLGNEAYGVAIKDAIEQNTNRKVTIGSLHSTITRLEEKELLTSSLGGATTERGGRRKRYFQITDSAKQVLYQVKTQRDNLWNLSKLGIQPI